MPGLDIPSSTNFYSSANEVQRIADAGLKAPVTKYDAIETAQKATQGPGQFTRRDKDHDNWPDGNPAADKTDPGEYSAESSWESYGKTAEEDSDFTLHIPDWGYQDFIAERASFVKGFDSSTGDQGWFYFKIFFRFDTQYGLLGNLLDEDFGNGPINSANIGEGDNAYKYLLMNTGHYSMAHMENRARTLKQFGRTLSFINCYAPWFFETISGLDKASSISMENPLADKYIELGFKEDAVDMRVSSLMDLYKYACYDYMNMKEVVPQNLRQFEMVIVLFHTPLRWYHTGMQTMRRGSFPYKSLNASNMNDRMSYKMYTFKGCEFVLDSLGSVYPGEVSNENPFNLGKSRVQISYKRCYQHTLNEWSRFMIGDDGIYWEDSDRTSSRLMAIADAGSNPYYYNPGADIFKPLVDASEAKINYAMRQVLPEMQFGNLYLDYNDPYGNYAKAKLDMMKNGSLPGEKDALIRRSMNDQGLFRNAQNTVGNVIEKTRKITQGNFF